MELVEMEPQAPAGVLRAGLDVGSTTIKMVVIDESGRILHRSYQRHFSEVRKTMVDTIVEALERFPGREITLAVAG
ncbi:MAG: ROK family protein, partial [Deltaproteobacteria bacterium]|nr:ROK family protein [Deltaproteobacteria bacterium]